MSIHRPRTKSGGYIRGIARGADPELMSMRYTYPDPLKELEDVQDYRALRPLFEFLPYSDVEVYCYKEDASVVLSRDAAVRMLILTMKAKIGKIEIKEWRKIIEDEIYNEIGSAESEASYIAERAGGRSICIDGSEELMNSLSDLRFEVEEMILDRPCKPLDILGHKIKREILYGEVVSDEEIKSFIESHLRFVDMIIEMGYEEAYKTWADSSECGVLSSR